VRPAWGVVPGPPPAAHARLRRRFRAHEPRRLLDPAARRPPGRGRTRVLEAHARLAGRPPVAVLALGLAAVPRGPAGPARPAASARGALGRRCRRRLLRPAAQVAAAAGRADRGVARRRRARPDALVLRAPPVFLPVRRARRARAPRRARPRRSPSPA